MRCRFSERGVSSKSSTPCYFHAGCLALPELTHVKAVGQFAPAPFWTGHSHKFEGLLLGSSPQPSALGMKLRCDSLILRH